MRLQTAAILAVSFSLLLISAVPTDAQTLDVDTTDQARLLFEAADASALERKGLEVQGRHLRLIEMKPDGVVLRDDRRAETIDCGWTELPPLWQAELLKAGNADNGDALFAVGAAAIEDGQTILGCRLLGQAVADDASQLKKANGLLGGEYELLGKLLVPAGTDLEAIEKQLSALEKAAGKPGRAMKDKNVGAFNDALNQLEGMGEFAAKLTVETLSKIRARELTHAEKCTGLDDDLEDLIELKATLDEARKDALELIEDEEKWPYPYAKNDKGMTAWVLRLVRAVEVVWNDDTSTKGKKLKDVDALYDRIARFETTMANFDEEQTAWQPLDGVYLNYLRALHNKELTVRLFAGDRDEMECIGWSESVRAINTEAAEKFEGKAGAPDVLAWKQLEVTNDYREMMGRHALKMNFKLYWASAHHSHYCKFSNGGKIEHEIDGHPMGRTPTNRANREGYDDGVGENLTTGLKITPLSAHKGWLTSSGHHRNIIDAEWRVMGNGKCGNIWTQLFGALDEGDANLESKGGR